MPKENIGYGSAFGYYYGYLRLVLPGNFIDHQNTVVLPLVICTRNRVPGPGSKIQTQTHYKRFI